MKSRQSNILAAAALGLAALLAAAPAARAQNQNYCREYQRTVTIGGVAHQAYGTACQGPDGQWRITDENLGAQAPAPAAQIVEAPPAYYPPQAYAPVDQVIVVDNGPRYYRGPRYYDGDGYYPDYAYAPVGIGLNFDFGRGGYYHGGHWH